METLASIRKHPIHVILVTLPLGLWIFSLVCDLIHYFNGNPDWAIVANYTLLGGIITALLAAIPGVIDLLSITEPKLRRIGVSHMIINLVVVGLYVVNAFLRHTEPTNFGKTPVVLSIVGVLLLSVSAWLGGELVHVYRVSVAERTSPNEPRGT